MIQTLLLMLLALTGGIAVAAQAGANSGLGGRIGLPAALLINSGVVFVLTLLLWAARGAQLGFTPPGTPRVLYIGGLCGFVIIASVAFAFPRLGAAHTVALVVLGQGLAAMLIDHYGWLDVPANPATLKRSAGVLLLAVGAFLSR